MKEILFYVMTNENEDSDDPLKRHAIADLPLDEQVYIAGIGRRYVKKRLVLITNPVNKKSSPDDLWYYLELKNKINSSLMSLYINMRGNMRLFL